MVVPGNNENEPLVSFVVNCYNGEQYLDRCLQSILKQQYSNWELIFWNNASTDRSKEIFNSYEDNRFKYFESEKKVSLGQARAWAVEECQGEYIAFLDVDDEWLPEKTKIQVERMIEENSVLSYGGIIEFYELTNRTKKLLPKHITGDCFQQNLLQFEIQMPTIMIKRETLIEKNLNFDKNIYASEEYCLCMQLIINERVSVINKPIAIYAVRRNSLTNKHIARWAYERRYTLNKIIESNPKIVEKYTREFKESFFRANYYEAEYLKYINRKKDAIKIMQPSMFFSLKYFAIYVLLNMPDYFWNYFQTVKYKRL